MPSLYNLTGRMLAIQAAYENNLPYVDDDTGEVIEGEFNLIEALEAAEKAEGFKGDAYIALVRNWQTSAMSVDAEIKRLNKLKKHYQSGVKGLMQRVENQLIRSERTELKCDLGIFRFSGHKSVQVDEDVSQIPDEYKTTVTDVKVDKRGIAKLLREGKELLWARWAPAKVVLK